jgi:hypothetical protein
VLSLQCSKVPQVVCGPELCPIVTTQVCEDKEKTVRFASDKKVQILLYQTRVARWFAFKPKIQIWVNFGGSCNGRCRYILWTLGPFYGLLLHFMDIWYSLWKFGIFFPFWYFERRKLWQPCIRLFIFSQIFFLGNFFEIVILTFDPGAPSELYFELFSQTSFGEKALKWFRESRLVGKHVRHRGNYYYFSSIYLNIVNYLYIFLLHS